MPTPRTTRTTEKRARKPRPPTKREREKFLAELARGWSVRRACDTSGIPRSTAYQLREKNAEFAADWDQAVVLGAEPLEDEALRRAVEGVEDFRLDRDGVEHPLRRYSDTLLIFLLKARRPDVYRDNVKHEHTGTDGEPIKVVLHINEPPDRA